MTTKTFLMSYIYSVPHQIDFTVDAETEDAAKRMAEEARAAGGFSGLAGAPIKSKVNSVFVLHGEDAGDPGDIDTLAEITGNATKDKDR